MKELDPKEKKLLKDLKGRFCRDLKDHKKWVTEKRQWSKFYDGDQWTSEELRILKERNQPVVTNNHIKPKMDSIFGLQQGLKVNTRAFDRGLQDFEKAKHISEALRQVEQLNDFDSTEAEAFEDQTIDGRGWYKVGVKWDGLDADPYIEIRDNEDIVKDCQGKKTDLSDSKQIHETVWTNLEDAQELFPHHKEELEQAFMSPDYSSEKHLDVRPDQYKSGESDGNAESDYFEEFINKGQRELRLVTTYWRTPFRRSFIAGKGLPVTETTDMSESDIEKAKEGFEDAVTFTQLGYRLNVATYCYNVLLEVQYDIKPHDKDGKLPFVWIRGYKSRDKEKPWFDYGLVRQMMDSQREINKRRAKGVHILATNKTIIEEGMVDDIDAFRAEAAKPDGVMVVRAGAITRIIRETDTNLAAAHFSLLQESKNEIDQVGIKGELEGQSKASSGREFQLRTQAATQSLRKMFANLRNARRRAFLMILEDVIQQLWTEEKLVRITDDPEAGSIMLNQRMVDPQTGEVTILNNVGLGKYDLIVEESPETVTLQNETFETLSEMIKAGAPVPLDMWIEASPIPNKKKLLERMQQQQAAQQAQMAQAAAMQGMPAA